MCLSLGQFSRALYILTLVISSACRKVSHIYSIQGHKESTCNAGDLASIPGLGRWQPTLEFLPGESHGQRSLAGYSPWGRTESGRTEAA